MKLNHQLLNKATAIKNRLGTKKKLSLDLKAIVFILHEEHGFTFAAIQLLLLEEENIEITISALSKLVRVTKKKSNEEIRPGRSVEKQAKFSLVEKNKNSKEKQENPSSEKKNFPCGIVKKTTKEQDETIAYLLAKKKREGKLSPEELHEFGKLTN